MVRHALAFVALASIACNALVGVEELQFGPDDSGASHDAAFDAATEAGPERDAAHDGDSKLPVPDATVDATTTPETGPPLDAEAGSDASEAAGDDADDASLDGGNEAGVDAFDGALLDATSESDAATTPEAGSLGDDDADGDDAD
jgi:hypothetical protein